MPRTHQAKYNADSNAFETAPALSTGEKVKIGAAIVVGGTAYIGLCALATAGLNNLGEAMLETVGL